MSDLALGVLISANAEQATRTLTEFKQKLETVSLTATDGFRNSQRAAGLFGGGLKDSLTDAGRAWETVAGLASKNPFGAVLEGALFAKTAITGLLGAFNDMAAAGDASLKQQGRLSRELRISATEAATLGHAARRLGIDGEDAAGLLQHLNRHLGEASAGSAEARQNFARLGLDWRALQAQGSLGAFGAVAGRLNAIGNAADFAGAAQGVFGKAWQANLPLIQRGPGFLAESADQVQRMGGLLGEEAKARWDSLQALEKELKAKRELAQLSRDQQVAASGVRTVWAGIGQTFTAAWDRLNSVAPAQIEAAQRVAQQLDDAERAARQLGVRVPARYVSPLGPGELQRLGDQTNLDTLLANRRVQERLAENTALRLATAFQVNYAQERFNELLGESLRLSDPEFERRRLAVLLRVNQAAETGYILTQQQREQLQLLLGTLEEARRARLQETERLRQAAQQEAIELWQREAEAASAFADGLRGPLELFRSALVELDQHGGFLDPDQLALGAQRAVDQLERALGGREVKFAGAAVAGSAEAISAVNQFRAGGPEDPAARLVRLQEQAEQQRQEMLQIARDTLRALENQQRPQIAPLPR